MKAVETAIAVTPYAQLRLDAFHAICFLAMLTEAERRVLFPFALATKVSLAVVARVALQSVEFSPHIALNDDTAICAFELKASDERIAISNELTQWDPRTIQTVARRFPMNKLL